MQSNAQTIYSPLPVLYKNSINDRDCVNKTEVDIFNALNFIISAAQGTPNINPKYTQVSESSIMQEWLNCIGESYNSNKTFSTSYSPKITCPEDNIHNARETNYYSEDNLITALHVLSNIIYEYKNNTSP